MGKIPYFLKRIYGGITRRKKGVGNQLPLISNPSIPSAMNLLREQAVAVEGKKKGRLKDAHVPSGLVNVSVLPFYIYNGQKIEKKINKEKIKQ